MMRTGLVGQAGAVATEVGAVAGFFDCAKLAGKTAAVAKPASKRLRKRVGFLFIFTFKLNQAANLALASLFKLTPCSAAIMASWR